MAANMNEDKTQIMTGDEEEHNPHRQHASAPKHSYNADDAMQAFAGIEGETVVLDEATNKRLLKKIDWHLMPLLSIIFAMNALDKATLTIANTMGMHEDIHLVGDNYQWLGSIFFFGYLAWEYPSSLLLQRLPIAKYCAVTIVLWGMILAFFATVVNFEGAAAVRFFLGAAEATVLPAFTLVTSKWYRIEEQAIRNSLWYASIGTGNIVGCLLGYGIAVGTRIHGAAIAPWKILFVTAGLATVALGVWFWWVVPDNQLNARWLNEKDRVLAVERVRVNQQGIGNKYFKTHQLKEALTDPVTWALLLFSILLSIPVGGLSAFFTQLVQSFGYTREESLLYSTPAGGVMVVGVIASGFIGTHFRQRLLVACAAHSIAVLGVVLIVALPVSNSVGRLIGYYLTYMGACPFTTALTMISSNVAGYTKKTTVAALYVIGYCVGNIIGPQTFRPEDAPRYVTAEIIIIVCWSLCILDFLGMWWWYRGQNARRARIRAQPGYQKVLNQEWLDLTDKANDEFVYCL